jgi:hypothetical protein
MKRTKDEQGRPRLHSAPADPSGTGLTTQHPVVFLAAGPLVLLASAAIMAWWTWGAWPDVLVDFGQQLYLAWQLAEGRVLFTDLAYFNGPLSPYVNALAFKVFGVGLRTLVVLNLFWMSLLVVLLHHGFRLIAGRLCALAACLVFVLLFGFAQYVGIGNYNYVCPYTHEMTHGLILSLASMLCIWHAHRFGSRMLAAGGLLLGLAFLTKAEVFIAGAAGTGTALVLALPLRSSDRRTMLTGAACFLAGFLVPPVFAFLLLCLGMPPDQALRGTMGSWVAMVNEDLTNLVFFRRGMGLADLRGNLALMAAWAGRYAAVIVPMALLSLTADKSALRERVLAAVTTIVVAGALWALWDRIAWGHAAKGLLPALLVLGAVPAVRLFRVREDPVERERRIRQISMIAFALAMLGKMALNARIYHYGFVLAMPATLVAVTALVEWIPASLSRFGGSARVFRAGAFVLLGGFVFAYLSMQGEILSRKNRWVAGPAGDALRAGELRGDVVNKVLEVTPELIQEGDTLAALPEGVMLNFLLRRPNPTPYTNFMPTEVVFFGEDRMVEAFEANPPDWIMLVHKDTSEFGFRFFGRDYGQDLFAWIMETYRSVGVAGAFPLQSHRQGVLLMARKEPPSR